MIKNARANHNIERGIDKWQRTNIGLINVVQTALAAKGDGLRRQIDTGKDAWICCRVDDPISDWNCFKIARAAQIFMDQLNASFLKRFAVQLASRAAEIVDATDLIGRVLIEKSMWKAAADKAADTRD
ncbi:MAG: hypothetical protein AUI36_43555 [Cyanobacteria bacterium 13_1_40CM_2_61_4]|nr:MAG: hypothetical protein AUI36_43555 [Cyanobacteria bacterium 13_1_40CM_2_61_4]